jgi:glycine/D-amino acid oxidase-like deaminating enzyme
MATNAYSNPLGLMRRKVVPFYVYNIATEPLTKAQMDEFGWRARSTVFNMKHMFWVIRLTADNRVVFINNDALYFYDVDGDYSNRPREYRSHYELLVRMFPFLKGIKMTHHWGGRIGMTLSFLPCIGRAGEHGNIYYSMGYNGHGVAFSQMAGKMLAELIAGEDSALTSNMLINKPVPGIPTAFLSYLGINGYKMMYAIDDWLLS